MAQIIRGKEPAADIRNSIRAEIEAAIALGRRRPGLAVVQVGADPAAAIYAEQKRKDCADVGMLSFSYNLPDEVPQADLLDLIAVLNADSKVDGIICHRPLPTTLAEAVILGAIDPGKDVDCVSPCSIGLLDLGQPNFPACSAAAVMALLHLAGVPIAGSRAVVIGRSSIVGKPTAKMLLNEHATVTIAHSRTHDLPTLCLEADILVVAIGRAKFVTDAFVKPGAVVIDVGINFGEDGKMVGDVDADLVSRVAAALTPVPNGVGPMTRAMLLRNTMLAWNRHAT